MPTDFWKETYTGRKYWPLHPSPDDVCIEDIAHQLSLTCRFNGACSEFYSVAQHSVLVSSYCNIEDEMVGLMHDAAEIYLSDIPSPVKAQLVGFKQIEEMNMRAIAARFGFLWPMPGYVKDIDRRMLATEKRDLMKKGSFEWGSLSGVDPYDIEIMPVEPEEAEADFLAEFERIVRWSHEIMETPYAD